MSRKQANTPRSRIRSTLRQLWMKSRERAAALKRSGHKCEICQCLSDTRKGGTVKLEVHHLDGVEWENILNYVQRHLLVHPDKLEVLCKECHEIEHESNN